MPTFRSPPGQLSCPRCRNGWKLEEETALAGVVRTNCPHCHTSLQVRAFATLRQPPPVVLSGRLAQEGEATCFFHTAKQATSVCDGCGRYLCPLCNLPLGTRQLCPQCVSGGLEKSGALPELPARRVCWSRLAMLLAGVPLLLAGPLFFVFIFTAPAAIFCALYGWNKPGSLVYGRRRVSAVLAVLLGLLQLAVVAAMSVNLWNTFTRG